MCTKSNWWNKLVLVFRIKFKYVNHEALNKQIFVYFMLGVITDDKVIRVINQRPVSLSKA